MASITPTQLNRSQQQVLDRLKATAAMTVRQLAEQMDMTTMGVRQHLSVLEQAGLVKELPEQKQGRGRPVRPWGLTQQGHQTFPDAHAEVTVELIASVKELLGQSALDHIIDHRHDRLMAEYEQLLQQERTIAGKLQRLADKRSEEGYMAELEQLTDGEYLLKENHCPICAAAEACQGFCRAELELFSRLFDGLASVRRESHILAGASRCCYRFSVST